MESDQAKEMLMTRRRLSVVSDNFLVEGLSDLGDTNLDNVDALSPARAERGRGRGSVGMGKAPGVGGGGLVGRGIGGCGQTEGAAVRHHQHEDEEDQDETIPCVVSSYAGFSKKGYAPYNPRKRNQDALIMAEDASTASLFLAVMDGHGEVGDRVAQKYRRHLAPSVFGHPDWQASPEMAVADSISEIERALLGDPLVDTDYSGTTLVSVCVRGSQLVLTNIGDSRATLGRRRVLEEEGDGGRGGGWQGKSPLVAQRLTEDHKPETPSEKQRILNAGGRVFAVDYADGIDGPPRVWLGDADMPGLAMSRSLGDAVAHTVGVVSDPDTFRCDLTAREAADYEEGHLLPGARGGCGEGAAVLILATDGLWEFLSDQEAIDMASQCSEPSQAVEKLTQEAARRWMKEEQVIDDITVCVAFLNGWASGGKTG